MPSNAGHADHGSEPPPAAEQRQPEPDSVRDASARPKRRRLLPEDHLARAMEAKTAKSRANWARKGLAFDALDPTTHAMLLRQLYLAQYAMGDFEKAYDLATQALEHDVLPDVIHQDAARAKQAVGDVDGAVGHLRLAARVGPPSRRAFHHWTLGAVLFVAGRHEEAIGALERAARWGTTDKPLYQGHLALARAQAGRRVRGFARLISRLEQSPSGQGYGRFVLGQLAFHSARYDEARQHLEAFVRRTERGRLAMRIALDGEMEMARATLAALDESA